MRDQENDERSKGRHFQIRYDIDTNDYYMKDLGCGFGTFLKVKEEIVLRNNALINIGDSYIVVTLSSEQEFNLSNDKLDSNSILLKVFNSSDKTEQL